MKSPPYLLGLLASPIRWQLVQALLLEDLRVHELCQRLDQPMNLVSYHLRQLRDADVLGEHRSRADGRDIYYQLNRGELDSGYRALGRELQPGLPPLTVPDGPTNSVPEEEFRVLFLCTHNSARSQMAEALLRARLGRQVQVASAGTQPSRIHPLAQAVMAERQLDLSEHRPQHFEEYLQREFDYLITVCDQAREECPVFPGAGRRIHWSLADPAQVEGAAAVKRQAFESAAAELEERIERLVQYWCRRELNLESGV